MTGQTVVSMTQPTHDDSPLRAAISPAAMDAVSARAPENVELIAADADADLTAIDFLVAPGSHWDRLGELKDLTRLKVVQTLSAGTDWVEPFVPPQATLCSARGARDEPVAEWVIAALLGTTSGLLECARLQTWTRRSLIDLARWRVVIVGMGSIGHMVADRLEVFGTHVVGVASRARGDLYGIEELPGLLGDADAVVVLAPLTDATRGLIGAKELAAMADGALLINAARGQVVDTDALVAETQSGRLRAVLDVTDPEPLPDDHPLWSAPGVLAITPHIAGDSPAGHDQAAELAADQLNHWAAGEALENIVREGTD